MVRVGSVSGCWVQPTRINQKMKRSVNVSFFIVPVSKHLEINIQNLIGYLCLLYTQLWKMFLRCGVDKHLEINFQNLIGYLCLPYTQLWKMFLRCGVSIDDCPSARQEKTFNFLGNSKTRMIYGGCIFVLCTKIHPP